MAGLVVAGAAEGAVLGAVQASVLVRVLPGFRSRRWVLATAAAASFAWLLGMLPASTRHVWSDCPVGFVAATGIPLGLLLLVSIGTAQAFVLPMGWRWRWVALTSIAWCAGLVVFMALTTPLWQPGQPVALVFAIGIAGGALMALVVAAVTAQALPRLARLPAADGA